MLTGISVALFVLAAGCFSAAHLLFRNVQKTGFKGPWFFYVVLILAGYTMAGVALVEGLLGLG